MKIEFHRWPPETRGGQQVSSFRSGVLAIDTETGVAVFVDRERSQISNQRLAEERLGLLVAHLPWSTTY